MTFREKLKDWVDIDTVLHSLASCLGMTEDSNESFIRNKGIYWSKNQVGDSLYQIVMTLVNLGYLLYDDEEMKFKWNEEMDCDKIPFVEVR